MSEREDYFEQDQKAYKELCKLLALPPHRCDWTDILNAVKCELAISYSVGMLNLPKEPV